MTRAALPWPPGGVRELRAAVVSPCRGGDRDPPQRRRADLGAFVARGTSFGPAVPDPKDFLITLLNGLTAAGLYFVVASGFTLVFGLMRVVNMAHGAFFLLGGYIALKLQRHWVGQGGGFGLTSDQVNMQNWVVPALIAAGSSASSG